ncbi:MAG: 2-phosphosulfolactate phosphatase [Bacteroidales bacterium]|nr:2-phosphosulfolactate phosphatase [Bacteroidales bacterium]
MKINVIPTAQQAQGIDFSGQTAVVIDVLRATTVITTALDNGACEVIPVKTVEEAQNLYATCDNALRGGERNALKIEGFDLGNSPLEYKKKTVEGKTLILTTTNGTNAINNIIGADEVVLACFRNAEAVASVIARRNDEAIHDNNDVSSGLLRCARNDVVVVCAGTEGRFSLDDGLCAGMLIELLKQKTEVETDDLGLLLNRFYNESKDNLFSALSECYHLKRLFMLGFYDDIKFCLETNCVGTVPILKNDKIVKL